MPGGDGVFCAQRRFQDIEASGPELALAQHPLRGRVERRRVEREEVIAAGDAPAHEARALEDCYCFSSTPSSSSSGACGVR